MNEIRVAIAGVGNCASNLIQGIEYYSKHHNSTNGLMHRKMGKYDITDIHVVAAFDISDAKVGKDLSEAIFCPPNCTQHIVDVKKWGSLYKRDLYWMDGEVISRNSFRYQMSQKSMWELF